MATVINLPDSNKQIVFLEDDEIELGMLIKEKLGLEAEEIYKSIIEERNHYRDKDTSESSV